jgi:threonine/homoserine/homoserine lactone efflux protein
MVWAFVPVAVVLSLTPGATTAMVVRSSLRGGVPAGVRTMAGNELGVFAWALLSVLGISALVAASAVAFTVLKALGAGVLVWLGVQSLRRSRSPDDTGAPALPGVLRPRAFRDGLVTALANPKLAVFFVALFPQFLHRGAPVLPTTLLMAALIVACDALWYTALSAAVTRARRAVGGARLFRRAEQASGAILIALGVRVALEQR